MTSKAATDRYQRLLLDLVRLPGNDKCADCHTSNPRWASWNLGIFLCVHCAGVHRKMGTHISKVRSVTLDTWTREQVECMKNGGNVKSNAVYNPDEVRNRPPTNIEQSERGSELEKYIRKKYELKTFLDRGPPPVPKKDPPGMQRKSSSLTSPRIASNGQSQSIPPSPSASSTRSFSNSTSGATASSSNGSSSRQRPPASPANNSQQSTMSSSSSRSLAVPARSSSSSQGSASSAAAASATSASSALRTSTSSAPKDTSNLLIPDIDSIPTQPSPSPTIALFPPSQMASSFMDNFSVAAAGTPPGTMGMGMGYAYQSSSPSPSLSSPFGIAQQHTGSSGIFSQQQHQQQQQQQQMQQQHQQQQMQQQLQQQQHQHLQQQQQQLQQQQQQQQQQFGLGVGFSPSAGYSPSPSPSIPGFGQNPFQQMQQQTGNSMNMGGGGGMAYNNGYQTVTSPGGLGVPFHYGGQPQQSMQGYSSGTTSPAPFGQRSYGSNGGGGAPGGTVQPQATGFDMFANGMMPAHMRRQDQQQAGPWG
ncbi:hypothetical protein CF327_g569 [Tilletia walkeri]|nr:hypothetical protein CF327_g569 [Tilletia walkeri]